MKSVLLSSVAISLFAFLVVMSPARADEEAAEETPAGMARIPAGAYVRLFMTPGAAVTVDVRAFYLDVYPVTNGQFLEFVSANPSWRRSQAKRVFADPSYLRHWDGDLDLGPQREAIKNSPVTNVSWFAAVAYSKWRGKRLPTLAEWESAAMAELMRPGLHVTHRIQHCSPPLKHPDIVLVSTGATDLFNSSKTPAPVQQLVAKRYRPQTIRTLRLARKDQSVSIPAQAIYASFSGDFFSI
jgi:Sulfatase-modifying factor enzyme 1